MIDARVDRSGDTHSVLIRASMIDEVAYLNHDRAFILATGDGACPTFCILLQRLIYCLEPVTMSV